MSNPQVDLMSPAEYQEVIALQGAQIVQVSRERASMAMQAKHFAQIAEQLKKDGDELRRQLAEKTEECQAATVALRAHDPGWKYAPAPTQITPAP